MTTGDQDDRKAADHVRWDGIECAGEDDDQGHDDGCDDRHPSSNGIRKGILPFFCSAGLGRHSKAVAELGMMTSRADNGFPMRLVAFLTPVNVAFIAFVNQRTNP